jgi:radical SAM superfamily enzyme YgiQ (UPF0313 family)
MKIAFINDYAQQIGTQYLAAMLKAAGHEVRVFLDPQLFDDDVIAIKPLARFFDHKEQLVADLKAYKPDLVGISVVTDFYQWATDMARMIKSGMDVPIILGGIHPSSVPDRVMQNKYVDMICVGEGEQALLELVGSMQKGEVDHTIRNIWFKKDGDIIRNEVRPLINDVDALPMPDPGIYFDHFPHFKDTGLYLIMATRGCPYACSYCCHSYLHDLYKGKGKYVRQRSVENVIRELKEAKERYGIRLVAFMDNCFGYDMAWLKRFSEVYKKEVGVTFECIMHPDHVNPESVGYLKAAGCYAVNMGIQSWNEGTRKDVLSRDIDNGAMKQAIKLIQDNKILLMTDSIFDLPGQTEKDIIEAAYAYVDIRPRRIYFYMLRYYPSTHMTQAAKDRGWITPQRYDEVVNGVNVTSFAIGGDKVSKRTLQFQILFYLIDLLPRGWSRYILDRKLYDHFPTIIGPAIIVILRNLVAFDMNARILRKGAFSRYIHYILTKRFG